MDGASIALLVRGDEPPVWPHGPVSRWRTLAELRSGLDGVVAEGGAAWALLWDASRFGPPPAGLAAELVEGRIDGYHAGLLLGTAGQPDDLDLVQPTWYFTVDPPAGRRAVSWRLTLDARLARTEALRQLGGIDPVFATAEAAGLDLGWRLLRRGALLVHEPRLVEGRPEGRLGAAATSTALRLSLADRYALLSRHVTPKWVRYVAVRRALRSLRPDREVRALRVARAAVAAVPSPLPAGASYKRPPLTSASVTAAPVPRISVVLPTLDRYELVSQVLEDLRAQTVAPAEVIVVDQTRPHDPAVFERHRDLPLTVLPQDGRGQWLARNAAVARATGDLLLFLDDDSRVPPEFVECHLACLDAFDAAISAGASRSVIGSPVPENYGFYRAADQFDSGNALVRRSVLAQVGGFDQQFDRMRSGDAEFGLRAHLAGALSVHNPDAYRVHFKAAGGGLRSYGSWDVFRQKGWFSPLPLPSVLYFGMRYFSPRQQREHLLIGLAAGIVPYERKRQASRQEWARYAAQAAAAAPILAFRLARSVRQARRMLADGPHIPPVSGPSPPGAR